MEINTTVFGEVEGQEVMLYTLKNEKGFQVSCTNYGCIITEILSPDRDGKLENVVLGYDTLEEYEHDSFYFGAVAGRFAGRIRKGAFSIGGKDYQVTQNENGNHLHGGERGFNSVIWNAEVIENGDEAAVEFSYRSPDGEEGYPGNLDMTVRYTVADGSDRLKITYSGMSDQDTPLNVTNHSYFNLSGDLKRTILDHELMLASDAYLELDRELLPTGKVAPVDSTVFDFRNGRRIQGATEAGDVQTVLAGNGYDHPFLLTENGSERIVLCDPESGRRLSIDTTEPAVVLYSGNYLDGPKKFRGTEAQDYLGLCLETQGLPDAVNHPHFAPVLLKAGDAYRSETVYTFSQENETDTDS